MQSLCRQQAPHDYVSFSGEVACMPVLTIASSSRLRRRRRFSCFCSFDSTLARRRGRPACRCSLRLECSPARPQPHSNAPPTAAWVRFGLSPRLCMALSALYAGRSTPLCCSSRIRIRAMSPAVSTKKPSCALDQSLSLSLAKRLPKGCPPPALEENTSDIELPPPDSLPEASSDERREMIALACCHSMLRARSQRWRSAAAAASSSSELPECAGSGSGSSSDSTPSLPSPHDPDDAEELHVWGSGTSECG